MTRRVLLWILNLLGLFVGTWALAFPASFYSDFPGLGLHWISSDGAFNEHLIRDVGELYLALAAGGIVAAISRATSTRRVMGAAWVVFSLPHLLYHLEHLGGLATVDAIGEPIALAVSLLLGIPLLLPERSRSSRPAQSAKRAQPTTSTNPITQEENSR